MTTKTKPTKVPIAERLRRAFAAATSDLQPRGRLPKGMTDDQATRALLAYAGFNLERFATAGEAMHKILAEDYDDEDDDQADDEWGGTPPDHRPPDAEPGSPSLPGTIPSGSATPGQIQDLLAQQDRETCRRFAIELLQWIVDEGGGLDDWQRPLTEIRRDLEMMETSAIATVAKLYEASKRPTLIKPDPQHEPQLARDIADEMEAENTDDGGGDA
jgi:hypothetical protein